MLGLARWYLRGRGRPSVWDKDFFTPNLSDETLKRDKSPKSNLGTRRQLGTAVAPPDWPRAGGEVTTPGTNWSLVSGLIPGAPRRLGCSVV